MSDAKLQAAKELIQEKDYAAARSVLRSMPDNPTAVKWLAKLEQEPPEPPAHPMLQSVPMRHRGGIPWVAVLIVILLVIGIAAAASSVKQQADAGSRPLSLSVTLNTNRSRRIGKPALMITLPNCS